MIISEPNFYLKIEQALVVVEFMFSQSVQSEYRYAQFLEHSLFPIQTTTKKIEFQIPGKCKCAKMRQKFLRFFRGAEKQTNAQTSFKAKRIFELYFQLFKSFEISFLESFFCTE